MTPHREPIPGIADPHGRRIMDLFQLLPAGTQVVLFGSRAKGNYREGSDIDLALKGERVTFEDRDRILEGYFQLQLPWKMDVLLYRLIQEPALKDHIDRVGRVLFQADEKGLGHA